MGLLSIFQRKSGDKASAAAADANPDSVQEARTRARRRLIGASVLVVVGVIGFPLVFETQPRPIPVDIPIEIPRKDVAPPLVMPPASRPARTAAVPVEPAPTTAAASAPTEIIETQADAGREVVVPPSKPAASAVAAAKPAASTAATKPASPASKPAVATAKPEPKPVEAKPETKPADDGKRAQALLEGKPGDKKDGRFVVQVGSFTENAAAHEMRLKVEKLGLKTYAQVAETSQGHRIRVRVGPFASRDEAEKVQARIKAAGEQAVVLTL
jgi:DedD protein